ncbi:MAG TPA: hypothetical protein VM598_01390 [Bdellovibrionota bacterium]|nr:hypothetical protein [Bdellovibrionota bacterium]
MKQGHQGMAKREFFQFPAIGATPMGGLPRGAIIEISGVPGAGKTELVLKFLAVNPQARVAWIEQEFTAYPCAFPQQGVRLDRVLFVQVTSDDPLWTVHQVLKSQVFGMAVLTLSREHLRDPVALRRLQIAAERSGCSVILLTDRPSSTACWPVSVQIQVSRDVRTGDPAFRVLKYRGSHAPACAGSAGVGSVMPGDSTTTERSSSHREGEVAPATELAVQTNQTSKDAQF